MTKKQGPFSCSLKISPRMQLENRAKLKRNTELWVMEAKAEVGKLIPEDQAGYISVSEQTDNASGFLTIKATWNPINEKEETDD